VSNDGPAPDASSQEGRADASGDASSDGGAGATIVDISAGQPAQSGGSPSAVIDAANGKLLVVTQDGANSNRPSLFRCNLDGTGCTWTDISAGQLANSCVTPSALIDMADGKLLVATTDNFGTPGLFRCNLDGTGCAYTSMSASTGGFWLSPVIDTAHSRLLTVGSDSSAKPVLYACNLDGTGCSSIDISAGQGANSGSFASGVIDATNGKLLVTALNQAGGTLGLFRCNLDGTGCTYTDISAGKTYSTSSGGFYPSPILDTSSAKLLLAAPATGTRPGLIRCNLDGTGCTFTDISGGQTAASLRAVLDTARSKLLVTGLATPGWPGMALYECNPDGTGCTHTVKCNPDSSTGCTYTGTPSGLWGYPSPVLDASHSNLLVATDDEYQKLLLLLYGL
jgi:hypothetical protein